MTIYGHPCTPATSPGRCLLFMPPLDEDLIERFVRFPGTLTPSDRAAAEELLRSDAAARELAAFFRTFYEELDGLDVEGPYGGRPLNGRPFDERPSSERSSDERPPPCGGEA